MLSARSFSLPSSERTDIRRRVMRKNLKVVRGPSRARRAYSGLLVQIAPLRARAALHTTYIVYVNDTRWITTAECNYTI